MKENNSLLSIFEPKTQKYPLPKLPPDALFGIVGEFVELASENSEADPAAILIQFLIRFGVTVGREPHFQVSEDIHRCNLCGVVVGETGTGKGLSYGPVRKIFEDTSTSHMDNCTAISGQFSSGEGIIHAVRDPHIERDPKTGKDKIIDVGVKDKRLFVIDAEFGGALRAAMRAGSIISPIVRGLWDDGTYKGLVKNSRNNCTDAHLGWVGHITEHELKLLLQDTDKFNGFANRILWVYAPRPKTYLLDPLPMSKNKVNIIRVRLKKIIDRSKRQKKIALTKKGKNELQKVFDGIQATIQLDPGLTELTSRWRPQIRRLAMIYCLLDEKRKVNGTHVKAAAAVWEYCHQSTAYIFGNNPFTKNETKLLEALKDAPSGLSRTEVSVDVFKGNLERTALTELVSGLTEKGIIEVEQKNSGNKKTKVYSLIR